MKEENIRYLSENSRGKMLGRNGKSYEPNTTGVYSENGLRFKPIFSNPSIGTFDWNPYTGERLKYEFRSAEIKDSDGNEIFKQQDIEVPESWSALASNVVASKYFYGDSKRSGERENSVPVLIDRVARTITDWGVNDGYFATKEDAKTFYDELVSLTLNQYGSFNSPVWFNVGLFHQYGEGKDGSIKNFYYDKVSKKIGRTNSQYENPQASACFIQKAGDSLEEIMDLAKSEAMLFKFGSGSGADLSTIRSSKEGLSGGGISSGPLSFLKIYDSVAGAIKSGGKTRRAAKMNTLKDWHPDIREFIEAKTVEEKKAHALIEQGYSGDFNGPAYGSVAFQNENLSVRLSNKFMDAVREDKEWSTHYVTDPTKKGPSYKARDILKWISEGTWFCGDPGVQFEDTINEWHTAKNTEPINSSNPCSEYMFLDDSACNLASLNLQKFIGADGKFDAEKYKRAIDVFITAQDILVDNASYPTEKIASNTHKFRTLGLGYANLGGLLMSQGLSYSSNEGQEVAKSLTALLTNQAYIHSARIASLRGAFDGFEENKEPMMEVISMHKNYTDKIDERKIPREFVDLTNSAKESGLEMLLSGKENGFRNAQVTVLAPTGTIGFMMDVDTTGIEPDLGLVKYKSLVGGGNLKIVNQAVEPALKKLGYSQEQVEIIKEHIDKKDTIEGAPGLKEEHLAVFDCSFKPKNGQRFIHYMDHLKMMSAVQPFLSGAISKTVNMPNEATVDDIYNTYIQAHELGLKAVALYRDGSKRSQPVSTGRDNLETKNLESITSELIREKINGMNPSEREKLLRKKMPTTRDSKTHKFSVGGHEGYVMVGKYDDGTPGEMFLTMAKEGSTVGGMMDVFGTAISLCLQYGVPPEKLVEKFSHTRFEPQGFTPNREIPMASSIPDYVFRWFAKEFLNNEESKSNESEPTTVLKNRDSLHNPSSSKLTLGTIETDSPLCDNCGSMTVRSGSCHKCLNCGNSLGCS